MQDYTIDGSKYHMDDGTNAEITNRVIPDHPEMVEFAAPGWDAETGEIVTICWLHDNDLYDDWDQYDWSKPYKVETQSQEQ